MGVPAFFRWLTIRYPKVVVDALAEDDLEVYAEAYAQEKKSEKAQRAADAADPNEINLEDEGDDKALQIASDLNRQRQEKQIKQEQIKNNNPAVDNLYLDMNGIIHPCAHPQNGPQPQSEQEIFDNIYEYTDKVIKIVKPQKVIYLAIDGVAPRAKQNQQRSRRFRTAKDAEEQKLRESEIKANWKDQIVFDETAKDDTGFKFDSNVITPGTEFMHRLSVALKHYILERTNSDVHWEGVSVVFNDAFVPGEGEHKILDFIRSQRAQPDFNPNTSHCIYGADADLIMLGLATHEAQFYILRECVLSPKDRKCFKCGQMGHITSECGAGYTQDKARLARVAEFQYVKISVVREYLQLEFKDLQLPFQYDFERLVDDFVFLCFFVGNDFLPHLPSLQIREGALDAIIALYKNSLPTLDGYLTNQGRINFSNCDVLFRDIAKYEEEFFRMEQQKIQREAKFGGGYRGRGRGGRGGRGGFQGNQNQRNQSSDPQQTEEQKGEVKSQGTVLTEAKIGLQQELQAEGLGDAEKQDKIKNAVKVQIKRMNDEKNDAIVAKYVDYVELGKDGYKYRYYSTKFHVHTPEEHEEFQTRIRQSYIEGLQWVLSYYYIGCESWEWFYPFHYAPFAADLVKCDKVVINFVLGKPNTPFQQLMSVFPKQSAHAVPECYRHLTSDPSSEIIDFYPTQFRLDVNGAAYAWMGVNLLPFIDMPRLLAAMSKADDNQTKLSEGEKERNKRSGDICLFVEGSEESTRTRLMSLPSSKDSNSMQGCDTLTFGQSDIVHGKCYGVKTAKSFGAKITKKSFNDEIEVVTESNKVLQVGYNHPHYTEHKTQLLENAILPPKEVEEWEIHHVDRRYFRGEAGIRMLEKVLNIDCGLSHRYKFGYQNNHGRHEDNRGGRGGHNRGQQAFQGAGQKRSYQSYSSGQNNQQQQQDGGQAQQPFGGNFQQEPYDPGMYFANKRQRNDNNSNNGGRGGYQQQNQGGYHQQNQQQQRQPHHHQYPMHQQYGQQPPPYHYGSLNAPAPNNAGTGMPPNPYMSSQFFDQQGGSPNTQSQPQQTRWNSGNNNQQYQQQDRRMPSRGGGNHRGNRFQGMVDDNGSHQHRRDGSGGNNRHHSHQRR